MSRYSRHLTVESVSTRFAPASPPVCDCACEHESQPRLGFYECVPRWPHFVEITSPSCLSSSARVCPRVYLSGTSSYQLWLRRAQLVRIVRHRSRSSACAIEASALAAKQATAVRLLFKRFHVRGELYPWVASLSDVVTVPPGTFGPRHRLVMAEAFRQLAVRNRSSAVEPEAASRTKRPCTDEERSFTSKLGL